MNPFVTHLEGAIDGAKLPADTIQTLHEGRPIWVKYDLQKIKQQVDRGNIASRPANLWRYHELLPANKETELVSLGEGMTPLLQTNRLGSALGLNDLLVKDEGQMPTGSFKDRGQTVAITMAKYFGIERVAIPTAGNAGGSMAAYAARGGLESYVFMPHDTPEINQYEAKQAGAKAFLVNGLINDCASIILAGKEEMGWFDISTLKEPYRIEGKKTLGLEIAEQLGWQAPDVIIYPTGGGTGLIGIWKAYQELMKMGWLESDKLPKMVAVQSEGCQPIITAFNKGERFAELHENADTIASGIRVPVAVGDFMILDAIQESNGTAIAVEEKNIRSWMKLAAEKEGLVICPEAAACVGAAEKLKTDGWLTGDEKVIICNCGDGRKYPHLINAELPEIDLQEELNWERISEG